MHKNRNFIESFKYAISGFVHALKNERNFRFHVFVTAAIMFFSYHFGLKKDEWIMLILAITFVLVCELVNTAIENAVDTATKEYSSTAKTAKDVAAGAVLTAAVSAILVGIILFFDIPRITATIHIILQSPPALAVGAVILVSGIAFVAFGGKD